MSGGKYVDSEVGLGGCAPGPGAREECLLLLSPSPNTPTAFLAPALSRLRSTPLALALQRNGPGRGGEEEAGMFCVVLLRRGSGVRAKLEGHGKGSPGSEVGSS